MSTPGRLVMWPDADPEQYRRDVQIAGWRRDSEHLRWVAANRDAVQRTASGKWRYEALNGQFYESDDLIGALVIAKDTARVKALHAERGEPWP